jgi:antitoxin ParD1/3/4
VYGSFEERLKNLERKFLLKNRSEVLRNALRLHKLYCNKLLEELHAEINKGWDVTVSMGSIKEILSCAEKILSLNMAKS